MDTRTAREEMIERPQRRCWRGEDDDGVVEQRRDAETVGVWSTLQAGALQIVKCPRCSGAHGGLACEGTTSAPSRPTLLQVCSASCTAVPGGHRRHPSNGRQGGPDPIVCLSPLRPFLFVASRTTVRLYHLARQELVKTLRSGCKWISCLAIHPGGDHCVVGSGSAVMLARPGSGGAGPSHAQISATRRYERRRSTLNHPEHPRWRRVRMTARSRSSTRRSSTT